MKTGSVDNKFNFCSLQVTVVRESSSLRSRGLLTACLCLTLIQCTARSEFSAPASDMGAVITPTVPAVDENTLQVSRIFEWETTYTEPFGAGDLAGYIVESFESPNCASVPVNTVEQLQSTFLFAGLALNKGHSIRITAVDIAGSRSPPSCSRTVYRIPNHTIAVGSFQSCTQRGGAVSCWGNNSQSFQRGTFGDGTIDTLRYLPTPLPALSSDVSVVSIGRGFGCAIQLGALSCWGSNSQGVLGDGTSVKRLIPTPVLGAGSGVTHVSAGSAMDKIHVSTCFIQNGAAKCMGYNDSGQLGDGTFDATLSAPAVAVVGLRDSVTDISVGGQFACAIHRGVVKCWGMNDANQLGIGAGPNSNIPVEVPLGTGEKTAVRAGQSLSCAIVAGRVECWGANIDGAQVVEGLAREVEHLALGESHGCGVTYAGATRCFGRNIDGQLGDGTQHVTPGLVSVGVLNLESGTTFIGVSGNTSCAIHDGKEFCWGRNVAGNAGAGVPPYRYIPVKTKALAAASAVTVGANFSCALSDGGVWCWGDNRETQAMTDVWAAGALPNAVPQLSPDFAADVNVIQGIGRALCTIKSGSLSCTGLNRAGELGIGFEVEALEPTVMAGMDSNVTAIGESTGGVGCGIRSGALFCSGKNGTGRLGNGTTDSSWTPVTPTGLDHDVTAVSTGGTHACAIQLGAAKCWGSGDVGELGDGNSAESLVPVDVVGLSSGVTHISAAHRATCAIRNGALLCWGLNTNGLLGLGEAGSPDSSVPSPVPSLESGVTDIAMSWLNACAIHNGAVKCWGARVHGIANGEAPGNLASPTVLTGLQSGMVSVSVHGEWNHGHACALSSSGAVWCWGDDRALQLGQGHGLTSSVPVEVFYLAAFDILGLSEGSDTAVDASLDNQTPTVHWQHSERAVQYRVSIRVSGASIDTCAEVEVRAPETSHTFSECALTSGEFYEAFVEATDSVHTISATNNAFEFSVTY